MMRIYERSPESVDAETIDTMLSLNGPPEGDQVEYKSALRGKNDDEKDKLIHTTVAFANARGGVVFAGIHAEAGRPARVTGLGDFSTDRARLFVDQVLRDNIRPPIPGVIVRAIENAKDGKAVLLVVVPSSREGPHMAFNRFRIRRGPRNDDMTYEEIAAAFKGGVIHQARSFRADRLSLIRENEETPFRLTPNVPCVVLHLLPTSTSFDLPPRWSHAELVAPFAKEVISQIANNYEHRVNLDGMVASLGRASSAENHLGYAQAFRRGPLEFASTHGFEISDHFGHHAYLFMPQIRKAMQHWARVGTRLLRTLDHSAPIYGMLSLLGVKGWSVLEYPPSPGLRPNVIDRDLVLCDPVVLEDFGDEAERSFCLSMLAQVWAAGGWQDTPEAG
jgi:hypothetical protein